MFSTKQSSSGRCYEVCNVQMVREMSETACEMSEDDERQSTSVECNTLVALCEILCVFSNT